jgi:hypothetical protein
MKSLISFSVVALFSLTNLVAQTDSFDSRKGHCWELQTETAVGQFVPNYQGLPYKKELKPLRSSIELTGTFGEILPIYFCTNEIKTEKIGEDFFLHINTKISSFEKSIKLKQSSESPSVWSGVILNYFSVQNTESISSVRTEGSIYVEVELNEGGAIVKAPHFSGERKTSKEAIDFAGTYKENLLEAHGEYRLR